ncbi:MarR family winged helix-turn-helix transcriptional regulator [Isoptericola nanjingensis]|uniref:MarR family winged helix-turn-helix transcriptional regulator n=1 Tax=Isoptericola TaxID=254250 RepID=UPI0035EECDC5|nr:winged helix-turn-helix transcriptional regulator [Isoptericola sp. QY 916]
MQHDEARDAAAAPGTAPHAWPDPVDPTSDDPGQWPTGRLLFTVVRRIEHDWNAHLAGWNLNHAGFPVLLHLFAGPRTQRELATLNGVTEQTMSRIVARLERAGYVTRGADPRDRRRRAVAVTDTGRRAAAEAGRLQPAEDLTARGLADDDVGRLREILVTLVRAQRDADD